MDVKIKFNRCAMESGRGGFVDGYDIIAFVGD
jgi:hypothetical protein